VPHAFSNFEKAGESSRGDQGMGRDNVRHFFSVALLERFMTTCSSPGCQVTGMHDLGSSVQPQLLHMMGIEQETQLR